MLTYPRPRMPIINRGPGTQSGGPVTTPQGTGPGALNQPGQVQPSTQGAAPPNAQQAPAGPKPTIQPPAPAPVGQETSWTSSNPRGRSGMASTGEGMWQGSYSQQHPLSGGYNALNISKLMPGSRGADIQQGKPGANVAAGAVQALSNQMQQGSGAQRGQVMYGNPLLGNATAAEPTSAANSTTTGKPFGSTPPPTGTASSSSGLSVGGGATPPNEAADPNSSDTLEQQQAAQQSNAAQDSAVGYKGDARGIDDFYDDKYGNRTDVPESERQAVMNQGLGAQFDEDVATDWGWHEGEDGLWTDKNGGTWRESAGVLTKVDGRLGVNPMTGLPTHPQEGGTYDMPSGGRLPDGTTVPPNSRVVYSNGQYRILAAGESATPASTASAFDKTAHDNFATWQSLSSGFSAPQMSKEGLNAQTAATSKAYAARAAEAMQAGLVSGARGGMSAEAQSGMVADVANRSGIAAEQSNASARLAYDMENFKAAIRAYDAQLAAVQQAMQYAQSDEERKYAEDFARKLLYEKAELDRQMAELQARRDAPTPTDTALSVAGTVTPVAGATVGAFAPVPGVR